MLLPRRMVFVAFVVIVLSACNLDQIGLFSSSYYNCLNLDDHIQVQLNTHLEPVPEIVYSTSPDGNFQIVSVARTPDYRSLYLEDVNTGKRILLDNAIHNVMRVVWSPNSQFVNYDWADKEDLWYRGIAETQTGEILLHKHGFRGTHLEAFSFDGEDSSFQLWVFSSETAYCHPDGFYIVGMGTFVLETQADEIIL